MSIVRAYRDSVPRIGKGCFIAENATLIGDVELEDEASVWYGAVLRGDCGSIRVGARSNIQDLTCVHMTTGISNTVIGMDVTVGHGVVIHGAMIGDRVLVGMGSVILDNAEIGADCLIAAGSVVPPRMKVPPGMLLRGAPAKIVREANAEERLLGINGAKSYLELAREHIKGG